MNGVAGGADPKLGAMALMAMVIDARGPGTVNALNVHVDAMTSIRRTGHTRWAQGGWGSSLTAMVMGKVDDDD